MDHHNRDPARLLTHLPLLRNARDRLVDRSALEADLEISRATAYRQTTELVEEGLLEQTAGGYRTTGSGKAALDAADRFERSLAAADRLGPLLEHLSTPELTRNIYLFADADLAVATPQNPNAPIEPWLDRFESFDYSRSLVVAGCPPAITEQGVNHATNDVDFEAVCTPLALQADQNASKEAFETIATAEGPSLYTHPDLPFTMGIIDESVIIIGFDTETTLPVASITTDRPEALLWAKQLYSQYKRESTGLEEPTTKSLL